MAKKKKKYDPLKSMGTIAGTTIGATIGTSVPFMVAGSLPAGPGKVQALKVAKTGTALMPAIPLTVSSGELLKSLKMFDE